MSITMDQLDSYGQIDEAKADEMLKKEMEQNRIKLVLIRHAGRIEGR